MILRNDQIIPGRDSSDRLIVVVHGWWNSFPPFSTKDVIKTIEEEIPDADLLAPTYTSHLASNTNPTKVSEAFARTIERVHANRIRAGGDYQEIILVGFSLGALIVRKAFVIASGQDQDTSDPQVNYKCQWPKRVSKLVLFAGVNRGWSLSPKPPRLPLLFWLLYHILFPLTKIAPIGQLIRRFRRGEPFVVNLRIQWQNLERIRKVPPVIQMVGHEEELVTMRDDIDVQFCHGFKFLSVPNTGHHNAMNFRTPHAGKERKRIFLYALRTPPEEIVSDLVVEHNVKPEVTDVVFVLHGIRDFGNWTKQMARVIESMPDQNQKVEVVTPRYERFPMSGFLLSMYRHEKVRWFANQYVEAYAQYPNAKFHFIGHSNGTYLLAYAMKNYAACNFSRVAFAGSVVPRAFGWDELVRMGRLECLRNDLASADWVVAIFPRFFEQVRELMGLPLGDIGAGGIFGFQEDRGNRNEVAYLRGGHGAGIKPENHKSLARFVLGIDQRPTPDGQLEEKIPTWLAVASSLSVFIWIIVIMIPILASAIASYAWYQYAPASFYVAYAGVWVPALVVFVLVLILLSTL